MEKKQKIMNYIDSIEEPQKLELILKLFKISLEDKNKAAQIINSIEKNTVLLPSEA